MRGEEQTKRYSILEIDSQTLRTGKRIGLWFIVNGSHQDESEAFLKRLQERRD